jgi:hypothetical protein
VAPSRCSGPPPHRSNRCDRGKSATLAHRAVIAAGRQPSRNILCAENDRSTDGSRGMIDALAQGPPGAATRSVSEITFAAKKLSQECLFHAEWDTLPRCNPRRRGPGYWALPCIGQAFAEPTRRGGWNYKMSRAAPQGKARQPKKGTHHCRQVRGRNGEPAALCQLTGGNGVPGTF